MVEHRGNGIIRPTALVLSCPGDMAEAILASVNLEFCRKSLPNTRIFLLVQERFASLYVNHPDLDGIFTVEADSAPEEIGKDFKKQKIDTLIHLCFSSAIEKAAKLSAITTIAFEQKNLGVQADLQISPDLDAAGTQSVFRNFKLFAPIGINEPSRPQIKLSIHNDASRESLEKVRKYGFNDGMGDYAVFCLDPNPQGNRVHLSVFSKTAEWITQNDSMPILVLGNPENSPDFLNFCRASHGAHILDLRGKTNPAEDAWLIKNARFCFCGECGHAYLASAMGCPLIALFVDFSEERWFSLGHLSTNIFTGAHRFFLEPNWFYTKRAARAFPHSKITSALKFSLALSRKS